MKWEKSKPSKLAGTEGLQRGNTNLKPVFTSKNKSKSASCQPPSEPEKVEIIWHREGKITPELKRVFAMLLRGLK